MLKSPHRRSCWDTGIANIHPDAIIAYVLYNLRDMQSYFNPVKEQTLLRICRIRGRRVVLVIVFEVDCTRLACERPVGKGGSRTMRTHKPTAHKRQPECRGQHDEHGLSISRDGRTVDAVEDGRPNHAGNGVQQARRAEQLSDFIGRDVLRQRCAQRRRSDSPRSSDDTRQREERAVRCQRVAHIPHHIEEDSRADDGEVEQIGAGAALLHSAVLASHQTGEQGEDAQQRDDAAAVDDADELPGLEGLPVELAAGVDEDDAHGAHGDAEHDGVCGGEEEEVPAHGGGGAGAGGPEDLERAEEVHVS